MKKFYILFFIFCFALSSLADTTDTTESSLDYVIKITTDNGSVIKLNTTDFQYEISNFANGNGVEYSVMVENALSGDIALWQFVSQIIDLELLYHKAQLEGYAQDEEVVKQIDSELERQISQVYAGEVLDASKLVVTDAEKRAYWNRISASVVAAYGPQATYARMEREIEAGLMQEKMNAEYQSLIQKYQSEHGLVANMNQDPSISIGDFSISKSEFDDMFKSYLKAAAGQLPTNNAEVVNQVKRTMFNTFAAQYIILYEAKKNGYENTDEYKIIDKFVRRSIVTKKYIEDTIFETIGESTDDEIEHAYNQYGQMYNVDSMSFEQAHNVLDSLVKQAKVNRQQSLISSEMRYRYKIEKNLDALKSVLHN